MSNWLHSLPLVWMTLVVFAFTYVTAAFIYAIVLLLATNGWARSFQTVSPGVLSPLGTIFGLFIAFVSVQVWGDSQAASAAVMREASALRAALVLAASFPGEPEANLRALVHEHITQAVTREWPMMAQQTATLSLTPRPLAEAMRATLALSPNTAGQQIAQREIVSALQSALEARRQRILISEAHVGLIKWACLFLQASCAFAVIAIVHSGNRAAARLTLAIFATGVAAAVLLILAHDEPFTGEISVLPQPLLQVMPETAR